MLTRYFSLLILVLSLGIGLTDTVLAFDFDALFEDDLIVDVADDRGLALEEALLVSDRVELGGRYRFSVDASRIWGDTIPTTDRFSQRLGGEMYFDARPSRDFRVLGQIAYDIPIRTNPANVQMFMFRELFSDFHYDNQVFFRAGKQTINWGLGYFFSPADVINLGRIDPTSPDQDKEGPIALKANLPLGRNNYYLYLLFDDVDSWDELAIAPKMEFVLRRSEFGLGGFYQKGRDPRMMATISTTISDVAVFGEGVALIRSGKLLFQTTLGARFSYSDDQNRFNLAGASQYYYNGDGKQHYLAGSLGWNTMLNSRLSPNVLWVGNLSDGSGQVSASLSLRTSTLIKPSLGVSYSYGDFGAEFTKFGQTTAFFVRISLGSGSF